MRSILLYALLPLIIGFQNLVAQSDFIPPPTVKKIKYADREITFSKVTMNGNKTTYLAVEKGASVKIKTRITSKKNGDYYPDRIIQIYWGIKGYTSVHAKSFRGYNFKKKKSKHTFKAPLKDGIYYITMGGTMDYSSKNNNDKLICSYEYAFAVLKVGNPDPEKKIGLVKVKKGTSEFLKTTLVKSGRFGNLDKIEWFFEGLRIVDYDQEEIPLTRFGTYTVKWSNCLTSISDSFNHTPSKVEVISTNPVLASISGDSTDIAMLLENNDAFVLKNLIFDLNKSAIKLEATKELDRLAQIMKDNPSIKILLEGHTSLGNAKKNQILSEERVQSTKEYLVKQGVMRNNIEIKGWGQRKPLIITRDIEKGKINRRVEIRVLKR